MEQRIPVIFRKNRNVIHCCSNGKPSNSIFLGGGGIKRLLEEKFYEAYIRSWVCHIILKWILIEIKKGLEICLYAGESKFLLLPHTKLAQLNSLF